MCVLRTSEPNTGACILPNQDCGCSWPLSEGAADLERYLLPIQEAIAGGAVEIDLVLEPGIGLEASMMVLNGVRMATGGLL